MQISSEVIFDKDLQSTPTTSVAACTAQFIAKGGKLVVVPSEKSSVRIKLPRGAAIFPICSGGSYRSPSVFAFLKKFENKITLFPPHSANHGFDPYNGRINRDRSKLRDVDEYEQHFGMKRPQRAGFEHESEWLPMQQNPTSEGLRAITEYYNQHYWGPNATTKERIYLVFERNAHIAIHRLNQSNPSLHNATVVAINIQDIISSPPAGSDFARRTVKAYRNFEEIIAKILDTSQLEG